MRRGSGHGYGVGKKPGDCPEPRAGRVASLNDCLLWSKNKEPHKFFDGHAQETALTHPEPPCSGGSLRCFCLKRKENMLLE